MPSRKPEHGQSSPAEARFSGRSLAAFARDTTSRIKETLSSTVGTIRTRMNDNDSAIQEPTNGTNIHTNQPLHPDGNPLAPRPPRDLPTSLHTVVTDPSSNYRDVEGARATEEWYEARVLGGYGAYHEDPTRTAAARSIAWEDPLLTNETGGEHPSTQAQSAPRQPRGLSTTNASSEYPDPEGARATEEWFLEGALTGERDFRRDERRNKAVASLRTRK